ncbi:hypothetical protein [Phytomonospora endophytica]|uniref:Uncharacterized protein n=1 Tax=Phytomonospora endophytica TaxID=714109 RepID=A0A841G050_9ACTN|nr:hypothetical protein [Phytomonospora endophytica]MBB6039328.1 hypothetical protein [Phytomonospora endophytica]GIG69730.1 hypothetical protein Pen01_60250 [Phytomonospora endophytica]
MSDIETLWDEYQKHQRIKGGRCSCSASSYPCRWRADVRDAMLKLGVDPLVDERKAPA